MICGLCLGECPAAVENCRARAIEPHHVVSILQDRHAIGNLHVATAELHGYGTILAFLGCYVVKVVSLDPLTGLELRPAKEGFV